MTLGSKIAKQRKAQNFTQEQLAEILGVSRQSVSKWESDIAYPETDKLIKLGKLFGCSMDYLLNDSVDDPQNKDDAPRKSSFPRSTLLPEIKERKSDKTVLGLPLYHVGRNARGFIAVGLNATGVISVGFAARGVLSLGLISTGILSFGVVSLGLVALGAFAAGLLAAGSISVGIIAFGAISVGCFSCGAFAAGKYLAIGDYARAMIAVGKTEAIGTVYSHVGQFSSADIQLIDVWLATNVPDYMSWARDLFTSFLY